MVCPSQKICKLNSIRYFVCFFKVAIIYNVFLKGGYDPFERTPSRELQKNGMTDEPSASSLILKLRTGDEEAAKILWNRFFAQLLTLTRGRLPSSSRSMADEEDIVLSAMKSFCIGIRDGRFPELSGRESLWRLLLTITLRKLADKQNYDSRGKRDVARLQNSDAAPEKHDDEIYAFISREPNPEVAAECAEQIGSLLESLEHEDLKKIALMKMEGYTNIEVANEVKCSITSIERKLRTIRSIWSQS